MKILSFAIAFLVMALTGVAIDNARAQSGDQNEGEVIPGVSFSKGDIDKIKDRLGIGKGQTAQQTEDETEAASGGNGKSGGKGNGRGKGKGASGGGRGEGLPPGLAKRDDLPPGLAKMETLPPGLSKSPLPAGLEQDLGPPPPGTERLLVGGENVVLVDKESGKVLDMIPGKVDQGKLAEEEEASKGKKTGGNPDKPVVSGSAPNNDKQNKGKGRKKKK